MYSAHYIMFRDKAWSVGGVPVEALWNNGWQVRLANTFLKKYLGIIILRYDRIK